MHPENMRTEILAPLQHLRTNYWAMHDTPEPLERKRPRLRIARARGIVPETLSVQHQLRGFITGR